MQGEFAARCVGVRLTVAEIVRSAAFYTDLLNFERVTAAGNEMELRMGEMRLALRQAAPRALRAMPPDSRANDRWFRHIAIVVRDMTAAFERLHTYGVELISSGPQTLPAWNSNSAGIEAVYFRDPDGHPLELIRYPPDKGKAVWRESGEELFLGVDHSTIVVANTAASLAFYRDEIGLSVVGGAQLRRRAGGLERATGRSCARDFPARPRHVRTRAYAIHRPARRSTDAGRYWRE